MLFPSFLSMEFAVSLRKYSDFQGEKSYVFRRQAKADNNGVLINCCSPGFVQTDMTSQNSAGQPLEGRFGFDTEN